MDIVSIRLMRVKGNFDPGNWEIEATTRTASGAITTATVMNAGKTVDEARDRANLEYGLAEREGSWNADSTWGGDTWTPTKKTEPDRVH